MQFASAPPVLATVSRNVRLRRVDSAAARVKADIDT
jgi:hypothetical protein